MAPTASALLVLVCASCLATVTWALVPATAVSYAQMIAAHLNGQWSIQIGLGKASDPTMFTPHVCNASVYGLPCNQPPLVQTHGDLVKVSFTPKNASAAFRTLNNEAPQIIRVRLCYATIAWTDRAWRKKNKGYPDYGKDCLITVGELPFNTSGGSAVVNLDNEDGTPKALYYAQVCTLCTTPSGGLDYCACDKTENANVIETSGYQGQTRGMTAAAIVCSVVGPAFLLLFRWADNRKFKATGKGIKLFGL